jgi:hypothetical protein
MPENNNRRHAILKPWSPSEAQSMAKDAPDPLRAPTPFLHWLNQMCTIYSPLPGDVLIILKLAYGSKWQLVRELFHVPQRAEWGSEERGNNISLDIWLDTVCERVVKAEASSQADFSIVTQTIQKPDEAPVDFSQRFKHIWEESAGITMDSNMMFTVQTFINCLNPQTRSLLILTDLQWQEKTLTQLTTQLANMERLGMFKDKKKTNQSNHQSGMFVQHNYKERNKRQFQKQSQEYGERTNENDRDQHNFNSKESHVKDFNKTENHNHSDWYGNDTRDEPSRCFYCKKIGHREKYCRKKHSDETKPSAPPTEPVRAPHTMKNPLQRPGEYNHY